MTFTPEQRESAARIAERILVAQFRRKPDAMFQPQKREPMGRAERAKLDGIVDRHDRNLELNRRML